MSKFPASLLVLVCASLLLAGVLIRGTSCARWQSTESAPPEAPARTGTVSPERKIPRLLSETRPDGNHAPAGLHPNAAFPQPSRPPSAPSSMDTETKPAPPVPALAKAVTVDWILVIRSHALPDFDPADPASTDRLRRFLQPTAGEMNLVILDADDGRGHGFPFVLYHDPRLDITDAVATGR